MKIIEWKPIKDFNGYFINELGEVKSVRSFRGTREIILKGSVNQQGYKIISMIKNGKVYTKTLHRLLMVTFKENKDNLSCINHIDGNKSNNNLDNLEWCTYGHNEKEAYRLGLKESRIKEKEIVQLTKDYVIENFWKSSNEIQRQLGYSSGNICKVCNGNRKSAYGYIWRYVKDE